MIRPRLTIELRIHEHTWSPHYHSGTFFARPVRYYGPCGALTAVLMITYVFVWPSSARARTERARTLLLISRSNDVSRTRARRSFPVIKRNYARQYYSRYRWRLHAHSYIRDTIIIIAVQYAAGDRSGWRTAIVEDGGGCVISMTTAAASIVNWTSNEQPKRSNRGGRKK